MYISRSQVAKRTKHDQTRLNATKDEQMRQDTIRGDQKRLDKTRDDLKRPDTIKNNQIRLENDQTQLKPTRQDH